MRELHNGNRAHGQPSGKRPAGVPAEVEMIGGDAFNTDFTRHAARGAAVVYQCAQPEYTEWTAKFVPLQNSILEGAAAAGAKLVVGDNLYMYGEVDGDPRASPMPLPPAR
jgi:hypothetical protein